MKYKPEVDDVIKFKRDGIVHVGKIRWIASSGFMLITEHGIPVKTATGEMECDLFIDAADVIGNNE